MEFFKESPLIIFSAPVFAIAIGFELIWSNICTKKIYSAKGVIENIYLSALNIFFDVIMRAVVLVILSYCYDLRTLSLPWGEGAVYWISLLIAEDFLYYWLHRIDHQCRFFWAIHVTHHSSEEFNLTVGFRSSVFQPLYRFLYFIPLALFGFNPGDILLMHSITQIYGILVHTQLVNKLGILEHFIITPSHHRVHHACNVRYLDRNLGMVLIIWDKLFGTFTQEDEEVKYGLTKPVTNKNCINVVLHEWKAIMEDVGNSRSWAHKLKYIFGPPGWSHEKENTTDQTR